jgi:alpha-beta hydrolase superfamily lysophospholipase
MFGSGLFDLPLPGYSLRKSPHKMAGRSMRSMCAAMGIFCWPRNEFACELNPPFARLDDAVKDVGTVFECFLRLEEASTVHLVGFSWGTVVCARYVGQYPQYVSRLVLYAQLYAETNSMWLSRIGDSSDRSKFDPNIGAYRLIRQVEIRQRWDADIGSPYDCSFGDNDTTSTDTDTKSLLCRIASRKKEYQVISPGSHFLCVEKNRAKLYQSIYAFLRRTNLDVE